MANAVVRDGFQLPTHRIMQEKATRNKRKFRTDPLAGCTSSKLFPTGELIIDKDIHNNQDCHASACLMCNPMAGCGGFVEPSAKIGDDELEQCWDEVDWSTDAELQLEDILLNNLDLYFTNMMKIIEMHGYDKDVARNAMLDTMDKYGWRDPPATTVERALELLSRQIGLITRDDSAEDLRKLKRNVLGAMVKMVMEARPMESAGDAMWFLLISDMSTACACVANASESSSAKGPLPALAGMEFGMGLRGKISAVLPLCKHAQRPDPSTTGKMSTSCTVECMMSANHISETTASHDIWGDLSSVAGSVSTSQPVKLSGGRKVVISSYRRDASLRQKALSHDKAFRSFSAKASTRTCKPSTTGYSNLDRKYKSILERTPIVNKLTAGNMPAPAVTSNLSFSSGCSSSYSANTTHNVSPLLASATGADFSPFRPFTGSSFSFGRFAATEARKYIPGKIFGFNKGADSPDPREKREKLVAKLTPRIEELQEQMQEWKDWAQHKVMQAARRLGRDKEELQLLRQERDEVMRIYEERWNLEENTRKKLVDMEVAVSKANDQVDSDNDLACQLELENAHLRLEMEAAKAHAVESARNCQELMDKEVASRRKSQLYESQKALLQEELAAEKNKLSQVQRQYEITKEKKIEMEARWKQGEDLKKAALARFRSLRKEREQIENLAGLQENDLVLKAANDLQRYKSDIRELEMQISKLKLSADLTNISAPIWLMADKGKKDNQTPTSFLMQDHPDDDEVQREKECVMCLSEERTVVFLPCAHQAMCVSCNSLHEKQGMKECPSCRTVIDRRICIRYLHSVG